MSEYIISQNSNDVCYAYSRGRFWRWDESAHVWKESHLMAQKFVKAKAVEKRLTPEAFLTSDEFIPMDDYELPGRMIAALRDAKPCKNAPVEPVDEESPTLSAQYSDAATAAESQTAASPAAPEGSNLTTEMAVAVQSSAALGGADESTPAPSNTAHSFDYSGLDAQTVDVLHMAEGQYVQGKKMTEAGLRWMVNAVSMAHDALCGGVVQLLDNSKHGNRGDDSFRAWCASISLSKSSAYNLLRVAERFGSIEIDGKSILDVQPATLLYEAAKPSAPPELVEKVTAGEITSSAEYRAVLKENQQLRTDHVNVMNRAERAEHKLEAAHADIKGLTEQNDQLKSRLDAAEAREEEAWKMQSKAEARAKTAESQLDGSRQVAEAANRRADKWKAEAEAARKQPIVAVVDKDEVARQVDALTAEAKAQARSQVEDAQRRANEAEAKYQKLQQDADGFLAPEQACEQQARFIADSMRSMYLNWFGQACATGTPLAQMGAPLYALCGEIMSSLEDDTTINPTAAGSVEDAEREALFE